MKFMLEATVEYLKAHDGYVSGEDISRRLGLSRAAIWKYIRELRRQGYRIEAGPRQGYKLVAAPDKLFAWEIHAGLGTQKLGREVHYYETLPSTMDEAVRLAGQGAAEGTLVCSETQTKGRGRMGREWVSPKGHGVYFSLILRPAVGLVDVAKLTLVAAVAVCSALRQVSPGDVQIKWPNDLFLNSRKLGGILTELQAECDQVKFVVLGVGVNVNTPSRYLPEVATSLKNETGQVYRRVAVLQEILRSFEKWYNIFLQEGFPPILSEWKKMSLTLGKKVRVTDGNKTIEGDAIDVGADGGLLIRTRGGEVIKRMSGDVTMV